MALSSKFTPAILRPTDSRKGVSKANPRYPIKVGNKRPALQVNRNLIK